MKGFKKALPNIIHPMLIEDGFYVGIDPDIKGHGVASVLVKEGKVVGVELRRLIRTAIPQFLNYLLVDADVVAVAVERSWNEDESVPGLWNAKGNGYAAKTAAYSIGRCHQCGIELVNDIRAVNYKTVLQPPLPKCWGEGRDSKISHLEVKNLLSSINPEIRQPKVTNPETRDALLIALKVAGFIDYN